MRQTLPDFVPEITGPNDQFFRIRVRIAVSSSLLVASAVQLPIVDHDVQKLIEHFDMTPLPVEGTYFVSTYRSVTEMPEGGPVGTAMIGLYSAQPRSHSLFHRLRFDEVWHFYQGDPIRLVLLHPNGSSSEVVLGPDLEAGHRIQFVIEAETWQAGELQGDGRWALFGCTMSPGFTGTCFEGGRRDDLLREYPDRRHDIERLAVADDGHTSMPEGFAT